MKNSKILDTFLSRNGKATNKTRLSTKNILCSDGIYRQCLFNYNVLIAFIDNYNKLIINKRYYHYSMTTQKHINYIKSDKMYVNNYSIEELSDVLVQELEEKQDITSY